MTSQESVLDIQANRPRPGPSLRRRKAMAGTALACRTGASPQAVAREHEPQLGGGAELLFSRPADITSKAIMAATANRAKGRLPANT